MRIVKRPEEKHCFGELVSRLSNEKAGMLETIEAAVENVCDGEMAENLHDLLRTLRDER